MVFLYLSTRKKYLVNIVGPTAAGKTAVAIAIARHFSTEIISSDSRQFYREAIIGTARPSPVELASAPHHFIGHLPLTTTYSAGDFERDALRVLEELFKAHDIAVMAGGSGLYIKAVTEGLDAMPAANEKLRAELHVLFKDHGIEGLKKRLLSSDPQRYKNAELQNPQRIMRAIEIAEAALVPEQPKAARPFEVITIGIELPRNRLYERINTRTDQMISDGLIEEAKSLAVFRDTYAMKTVGYKELFSFFDGELSLDKAIDLIRQHTRNYAKRQLTWFKRDQQTTWLEPDQLEEMIRLIGRRTA